MFAKHLKPKSLAAYLLALVTIGTAHAANVNETLNVKSLHVVELFTSQGCNSCPPADALLGQVAQHPDVLALAYHVQYWDGLGWRDRFGLPEAEQRQYGYAAALHLSSAFTPQMIVNGEHSLVGSKQQQLTALLHSSSTIDHAATVALDLNHGHLNITVTQPQSQLLDVLLVTYLTHADTAIPRGENTGKTLNEFNIVRSLNWLGRSNSKHQQFIVKLTSLPDDATHAAVLLQQPSQGAILAAASVKFERHKP